MVVLHSQQILFISKRTFVCAKKSQPQNLLHIFLSLAVSDPIESESQDNVEVDESLFQDLDDLQI